MTRDARHARAGPLRSGVAAVAFLTLLNACAGMLSSDGPSDRGDVLRDSLPVAAAAFGAGQLDVARRLYQSLAERFPEAPEPVLGLGYIAFFTDNFAEAQRRFRRAADQSAGDPALKSEALIGAGRSAIARGRTGEARELFQMARDLGPAVPPAAAPWIWNGLAVAATLDGDYLAAEAHYDEAIRLSSGDPRLTANLVRMLVASGRIDEARERLAAHPSTFWPDDEGAALARLVEPLRPRPPGPDEAGERGGGAAPEQALSSSGPAPLATSRPGRPRTEDPQPAPALAPRSSLALRLSGLGPASTLPRAFRPIPDPRSSALVLRFANWPAPATPPAMNHLHRRASATAPVPGPSSSSLLRPDHATERTATGPEPPAELPGSEPPARPSPETLDLTLGQSRRLRTERAASAVSVAAPEVADVQLLAPNVLYVIARGVGRTSVAVLVGDEWSEERIVAVTLDLDPLRAILAADWDLREVQARPIARGVTLTGEVGSAEIADRAARIAAATLPEDVPIENALRVAGPQQVNLEVQIAEVNRSVTENLGVSWEAIRRRGNQTFGFRIGRDPTDASGNLNPVAFDGQPAASFFFGRQTCVPPRNSDCTTIGAMVDALAVAGLANVLARPNLTAVSGEPASFFSGGEFPLPTGFEDGVLTFEYKKYGVLLDFVPTVVDAGRIVLTVRPEVSEPSANQSVSVADGVAVPVINVRRAETTVEVGDGESIVIAGLFRDRTNTVESGVPGLKDVPLLGALFGHTSSRSDEVELIVIVTARLVRANAAPDPEGALASEGRRQAGGYHY